jgi:hypothetical protein
VNHEEHKGHEAIPAAVERAAQAVVDAGLKVHKALGPGLLESAYEHCLVHELSGRGFSLRRQAALPIQYDGVTLDALTPLHQLLTYLKLSGCRLGFLMNFNVPLFRQGLKRAVL